MTRRLGLDIPALVEFSPETKSMVIGAVKLLLKRLRRAGLLDDDVAYGDLLGDPGLLHRVIGLYKAHRDLAADVAVDGAGQPVTDDRAALVCGITAAQVERLLVFTCAKRLFAQGAAWDGARAPGALVPEELKRILAFDWQLPLLDLYRDAMTAGHFQVLGDAVLAVRDRRGLEAIAAMSPLDIAKIKSVAGPRFAEMLSRAPAAGPVLARLTPEKFALFAEAAGPRVWEFLAGDEGVRQCLMGVVGERVRALGPMLPDLCLETARVLTDLPARRIAPLMETFRAAFGDDAPRLLKDPEFATGILANLVGNAPRDHDDHGEDALRAWAETEWKALRPKILIWMRVRAAR